MDSSSAMNEQRRKDLELLALFDPDCPQDLSTFQVSFLDVDLTSGPSNSSYFPKLDEKVNTEAWITNLDDETLAYIDEIIAADEEVRRSSSAKPASKNNDTTFCWPHNKDETFCCPRKFKCPMCPKEFLSQFAMRRHGRRHILKQIKCPCGFRGHSPVQKHKHYLYHHIGMPKPKFLASF